MSEGRFQVTLVLTKEVKPSDSDSPVDLEVEKLVDADMTQAGAIALAEREVSRTGGVYRVRQTA